MNTTSMNTAPETTNPAESNTKDSQQQYWNLNGELGNEYNRIELTTSLGEEEDPAGEATTEEGLKSNAVKSKKNASDASSIAMNAFWTLGSEIDDFEFQGPPPSAEPVIMPKGPQSPPAANKRFGGGGRVGAGRGGRGFRGGGRGGRGGRGPTVGRGTYSSSAAGREVTATTTAAPPAQQQPKSTPTITIDKTKNLSTVSAISNDTMVHWDEDDVEDVLATVRARLNAIDDEDGKEATTGKKLQEEQHAAQANPVDDDDDDSVVISSSSEEDEEDRTSKRRRSRIGSRRGSSGGILKKSSSRRKSWKELRERSSSKLRKEEKDEKKKAKKEAKKIAKKEAKEAKKEKKKLEKEQRKQEKKEKKKARRESKRSSKRFDSMPSLPSRAPEILGEYEWDEDGEGFERRPPQTNNNQIQLDLQKQIEAIEKQIQTIQDETWMEKNNLLIEFTQSKREWWEEQRQLFVPETLTSPRSGEVDAVEKDLLNLVSGTQQNEINTIRNTNSRMRQEIAYMKTEMAGLILTNHDLDKTKIKSEQTCGEISNIINRLNDKRVKLEQQSRKAVSHYHSLNQQYNIADKHWEVESHSCKQMERVMMKILVETIVRSSSTTSADDSTEMEELLTAILEDGFEEVYQLRSKELELVLASHTEEKNQEEGADEPPREDMILPTKPDIKAITDAVKATIMEHGPSMMMTVDKKAHDIDYDSSDDSDYDDSSDDDSDYDSSSGDYDDDDDVAADKNKDNFTQDGRGEPQHHTEDLQVPQTKIVVDESHTIISNNETGDKARSNSTNRMEKEVAGAEEDAAWGSDFEDNVYEW